MNGLSFELDYERLQAEFKRLKSRLKLGDKLSETQLKQVRDSLSFEFKFAAGILSQTSKKAVNSEVATVWLSDDTLIKQLNSRQHDDFAFEDYAELPDILHEPDEIRVGEKAKHYKLYKRINGKRYIAVIKVLEKEVFVQSYRRADKD